MKLLLTSVDDGKAPCWRAIDAGHEISGIWVIEVSYINSAESRHGGVGVGALDGGIARLASTSAGGSGPRTRASVTCPATS